MPISNASRASLSRPAPAPQPASLGNLLQHLARKRPVAVVALETLVGNMLAKLG